MSNNYQQRGAVALITAIIVSVLLMITTAGMVALTLKSVRGSTDGAQSTKAYYAAESGLEEALLKLKRDPSYSGNCPGNGVTSASSAQDGVVTCTIINQSPNTIAGLLDVDKTVQIDLSAVSGLATVVVEWSNLDSGTYDISKVPAYINGAGNSVFPSKGTTTWPAAAPGVVEAALVEYPGSSQISIDQVNYYLATLAPKSPQVGDPSNVIPQSNGANLYRYDNYQDDGGGALNKPFVTLCNRPAPYQCKAAAFGLSGSNRYILRLKSRYSGVSYRVSVQNGSNTVLSIPNQVYTIDVTARAGDTFRRIQTSFPTGGTGPEALTGLDYVLFSDTTICKSFEIKTTATPISCQLP